MRHLLPLLPLAAACGDEPCELDAEIVPGCGVQLGEQALYLGEAWNEVEDRLGAPAARLDMGAAGLFFRYTELHVQGFTEHAGALAVVTNICVIEGFSGQTADDLGIGSSQADVEAALGQAEADPFTGAWWYADLGLGFEWEVEQVSRLQLHAVSE